MQRKEFILHRLACNKNLSYGTLTPNTKSSGKRKIVKGLHAKIQYFLENLNRVDGSEFIFVIFYPNLEILSYIFYYEIYIICNNSS